MPPGFVFTINGLYLSKYLRTGNVQNIINRYPGQNAASIALQATYWANIHGFVSGGTSIGEA